ncbi:MAG: hypothetical protein KBG28_22630 [Kofleriaceae bacterium]|nr:hypothetical protein [Kofleriaceae bacterium]
MPQLIEFPPFSADLRAGLNALVRVCKETPAAGESFREFRARLRTARLWDKDRPLATLRFLAVGGDPVKPSPFMTALAATSSDDAISTVVLDRLWSCNPLLAKAVLDLLGERAYGKDELYKFLGSSAYRGLVPSRPALEAWLQIAVATGLVKTVGIAITLASRAEPLVARAAELDVDDFLATDKPEPEPTLPTSDDDAASGADASPTPVAAEPSIPATAAPPSGALLPSGLRHLRADALTSPRGLGRGVPLARFSSGFTPEVLDDTRDRIAAWTLGSRLPSGGYHPDDFALDAEAWVEGADEVVYRIAVAAALAFRLDADRAGVIRAFLALDKAGVLSDLYHGTVPDALPAQVDARALMLASLAARRCAEAPDLASQLDGGSAAAAFAALDGALGRGLFRAELVWMLDLLGQLGVIRPPDLRDYTITPYRIVRDTLFRLGFLASPYAADGATLVAATRAARAAVGESGHADTLAAFAIAAGCAYDCAHRKTCEFACRERLE